MHTIFKLFANKHFDIFKWARFGYGADVSHYPFVGGVHHSDDLIYLFPDPPDVAKLNAADTEIAQMLVDLWTSFAIHGVPRLPQSESIPFDWKPFDGEEKTP